MPRPGLAFRQAQALDRLAAVPCSDCGHPLGGHHELPAERAVLVVGAEGTTIVFEAEPAYEPLAFHCNVDGCSCIARPTVVSWPFTVGDRVVARGNFGPLCCSVRVRYERDPLAQFEVVETAGDGQWLLLRDDDGNLHGSRWFSEVAAGGSAKCGPPTGTATSGSSARAAGTSRSTAAIGGSCGSGSARGVTRRRRRPCRSIGSTPRDRFAIIGPPEQTRSRKDDRHR